jgi:hypothetical protein
MSQRVFGTGQLCLIPAGTNSTAIQVGVLQDVSYDNKASIKKVYGNQQVAIDAGAGEITHSGKIKSLILNGPLIAALLYGDTTVSGQTVGVFNEQGSVPTTPFAITVTHSATWVSDLGVWDITNQKYLVRVAPASTPTTGQYKVTAGVYTFAAADTGFLMSLSYDYTVPTTGSTIKLTNQQMGSIVFFGMKLYNNFTDAGGVANSGLYFPRVYFSDQSLAFKNTDWVSHNISWEAIADNAGNVVSLYTGN